MSQFCGGQFLDTWKRWPQAEPTTVLCHGVFDLLHLGHIRHLQAARKQGDKLIVSVSDDANVRKGLGRPHFTAEQRAEALRGLECVDEVVINDAQTAVSVIEKIKPDVYVKGIDYGATYDANLEREIAAVEQHGGRFHVTKTEKWSSTQILNSERFPEDTLAYLAGARDRGFRDKIHAAFDRADKLKLAFVGETIVDEYRYVGALGKPSKEFVLATVEIRQADRFLGGAYAAHLHAEWQEPSLITGEGSPLRKTRFVDGDFTRKLFEVYSSRKIELDEDKRGRLRAKLTQAARDCDALVVLDFGHGLLGAEERHIIETGKFIAVNAQTNAGNCGFNPITNYRNINFACIDDPEARLAIGDQDGTIERVMVGLSARMMPETQIIVTHGRHGCAHLHNERFGVIPPFSATAVDTIGAGDAFLATSAPLVAAGLELEAAALVGNVAGAIKVSILGHQRHVKRDELLQTVDALLA